MRSGLRNIPSAAVCMAVSCLQAGLGLLLCLLFSSPLQAQVTAVTTDDLPWMCDFEDAAELQNWTFNPGSTGRNLWTQGEAEAYAGTRSLYISRDGGKSNKWDASEANIVYAYRPMRLAAGEYDFAFDWKGLANVFPTSSVNEQRNAYLKVFLTNRRANRITGQTNASEPSWWGTNAINCVYVTDANACLSGAAVWTHFSGRFTVTDNFADRDAYLLFAWVNNTSVDTTKVFTDTTTVMIDNLRIGKKSPTGYPSDMWVSCDEKEANVYWTGAADAYETMYRKKDGGTWRTLSSAEAHLVLDERDWGAYEFWVSSINGSDKSIPTVFPTVYLYPTQCFDVLNMYGADFHTGTWGGGQVKTTGNVRVDDGYKSIRSRHTTHFLQDEYDPRTGGRLKTVPDGEYGSVRLGNWEMHAEWESLAFKYEVNSTQRSVLLLKYAMVLENPNHTAKDQPNFTISITDEQGRTVDNRCTSIDFHAPTAAEFKAHPELKNLWHHYTWVDEKGRAYDIDWQDWYMIGIDLTNYQGQTLTVTFTSRDCSQGGHFGYAYFMLRCTSSELEGIPWGEDSNTTYFTAPEGFKYEWRREDDMQKVLSTDRHYIVSQDDTLTYYVDLTYLNQSNADKVEECRVRQEATARPHTPRAEIGYEWLPDNCVNKVRIYNKSHVVLTNQVSGEEEHRYDWHLQYFLWRHNGDSLTTDAMYQGFDTITVSNDGADLHYSLWGAVFANDTLWEDFTDTVFHVPAIGPLETYLPPATLCYGEKREFPLGSGIMHGGTGIWYDSLRSTLTGCDSTVIYRQTERDSIGITFADTVCLGSAYRFNGIDIVAPGNYTAVFPAASGCDSTVTLSLFCAPLPSVFLAENEVCPDITNHLTLTYADTDYMSGMQLLLLRNTQTVTSLSSDLPLPSVDLTGLRAGQYTLAAELRLPWCDAVRDTMHFSLNLPPAVVQAKWDNVLAVLNEQYNGGYRFRSFQWYRDGQPLPGQTGSWLYLGAEPDNTGEYTVEAVLDDGTVVFICPFRFADRRPDSSDAESSAARKVLRNQHIYIERDGSCYDLFGRKLY